MHFSAFTAFTLALIGVCAGVGVLAIICHGLGII